MRRASGGAICLSSVPNWAADMGTIDTSSIYSTTALALFVDASDNSYVVKGSRDKSSGQIVKLTQFGPDGDRMGDWQLATSTTLQALSVVELVVNDDGTTLLLAGNFTGSIDLQPSQPGGEVTSRGDSDVLLAKYTYSSVNDTWNLTWNEQFGGPDRDVTSGFDTAPVTADIYMVGTFFQTARFATSNVSLTNTAGGDSVGAFLLHLTDSGASPTGHWARQLQKTGSATPADILITDDGQALIAGSFGTSQVARNQTTFVTSSGRVTLKTGSNCDAILLKYELAAQSLQWVHRIGKGEATQSSTAFSLNAPTTGPSTSRGIFAAITCRWTSVAFHSHRPGRPSMAMSCGSSSNPTESRKQRGLVNWTLLARYDI